MAQELAAGDLRQSLYNHVTGEFLLAPAGAARVRRLRMPPDAGFTLLSFLREVAPHASRTS